MLTCERDDDDDDGQSVGQRSNLVWLSSSSPRLFALWFARQLDGWTFIREEISRRSKSSTRTRVTIERSQVAGSASASVRTEVATLKVLASDASRWNLH